MNMSYEKRRSIALSPSLLLLLGIFIFSDHSALSLVPNSHKNYRRQFLRNVFVGTLATTSTASAKAASPKSRIDGYAIQHTEKEWSSLLSGAQYNILRQGGTERQKSSILNTFTSDKVGTYICAGCATPLYTSSTKFSSGTGWPSFAMAMSNAVEVEELDPLRATLEGREARCGTCGGHLGDVFNDGWRYPGTEAFKTGQRYCIDGAALVFKPGDGGEFVSGDIPPANKAIQYEPSLYR